MDQFKQNRTQKCPCDERYPHIYPTILYRDLQFTQSTTFCIKLYTICSSNTSIVNFFHLKKQHIDINIQIPEYCVSATGSAYRLPYAIYLSLREKNMFNIGLNFTYHLFGLICGSLVLGNY